MEEITSNEIDIVIPKNDVSTSGVIEIDISDPDYSVTVNKKEYTIVGDGLYIPTRYEESPQWLRDMIDTVTNQSLNQKITELNQLTTTLNQLIVELDVAKNTYTQSIISSADIDERINTNIQTLNSSLSESDATIVELVGTKVTPEEATSISTDVLTSSINGTANGTVGALVGNVQTAIANLDTALSNSIEIVHSELVGEIGVNADAISELSTTATILDGRITANSEAITSLGVEVAGVDGKISTAISDVTDSLSIVITNGDTNVESKWGYNSNIVLGGTTYSSGFGLATNVNSPGNGIPTGSSEFWINASKLKFTNTNKTGSKAPFTIDATGTVPEITFNGKVSFSNVNDVPVINKTYVQPTQPSSGMNNGDIWINTSDNNALYSYNGSTWNKSQNGAKTYLQTTAPTSGMTVGDLWFDTDDNYKQYRYNGSTWELVDYNPVTVINGGTSTINGSKITTGSLTATQIQTNSISADRISSYNITSANTTFGSSIIGSAQIVDASITNAKLQNLSVNSAKIVDASITSAKIVDLSVSTLKIQDEAVISPRYASGNGSTSIMYTPAVTHTVYFMIAVPVTFGNFHITFSVNGGEIYNFDSTSSSSYAGNIPVTVNAGIPYTFTCTAIGPDEEALFTQLLMLGIKK